MRGNRDGIVTELDTSVLYAMRIAISCSLSPVLRGEGWGEGRCVELRNSLKGPSP